MSLCVCGGCGSRLGSGRSAIRMIKVSVVITARNEEKYLRECLESIQAQDYPHELMEVVLVDSASEDGTRAIMEDFARRSDIKVRILENPRGDIPRGWNIGFRAATGDALLLMIGHAYIPPNHISRAVSLLEEKGADGVCGRIVSVGSGRGTIWDDAIAAAMESRFGIGNATARVGGKPGWIDNPMLTLYRRSLFERFGYMDERLTRNEDYEFNQRCYAGGARFWFQPDMPVYYHNRPTLRALWRQYFVGAKWRAFMIGEHRRAVRFRHIVPPAFVLGLVACGAAAVVSSKALHALLAVAGAYAAALAVATAAGALKRRKPALIFTLPIAFATIHLAYGLGFLWGLMKFVVAGGRKSVVAAEKQ